MTRFIPSCSHPDNPPTVKILEPTTDKETITLRAKPGIVFNASDDYGLARLAIKYQISQPTVAGQASTIPPSAVESIPVPLKKAAEGQEYLFILDVGAQKPAWQEGEKVNYWIEAVDNNTATDLGSPAPTTRNSISSQSRRSGRKSSSASRKMPPTSTQFQQLKPRLTRTSTTPFPKNRDSVLDSTAGSPLVQFIYAFFQPISMHFSRGGNFLCGLWSLIG